MKSTKILSSRFNLSKSYINNLQTFRKLLMDMPYFTKKLPSYIFLEPHNDDKMNISLFQKWIDGVDIKW